MNNSNNEPQGNKGTVYIVGAGPSGLTAAYRLRQQGISVVLIDKRDRVGGMIHTHREAGYLMEEGATILPSAYSPVVNLAHEIGAGDDMIPAGSIIGFARDKTIYNLRSDHLFQDALKTSLVSAKSKLAMLRFGIDASKASKKLNYANLSSAAKFDTMTPKEYCAKHWGLSGEVYDYVIDSTVRGVLGVRGDKISNLELFFMLYNILGSKLYAFRNGYSTYIDKLAEGLDIRLNATVEEIRETANGVNLTWIDAEGNRRTEVGTGCIITARADTIPTITPDHFDDASTKFLNSLRYTKCLVMNTGVVRKPKGITASVINVPAAVDLGLMGFTCEHNKAPGRAPEGHGLMAVLTMTEWAEELMHDDDETVQNKMLGALDKLIPGVSNTVDYTRISRWNEVIVYSRPGLYRELGDFLARQNPKSRIRLAGVFRSSSNLCTATVGGETAAKELLKVIT